MIGLKNKDDLAPFLELITYEEVFKHIRKHHGYETWMKKCIPNSTSGKKHIYEFICSNSSNVNMINFLDEKSKQLLLKVEKEYELRGNNDYFDLGYSIWLVFKNRYDLYFKLSKNKDVDKGKIYFVIASINQIKRQIKTSDYLSIRRSFYNGLIKKIESIPLILSDYHTESLRESQMQQEENTRLREINDKIKKLIISRAVWAEFKKRDITTRSWRALKDFLDSIPVEELASELVEDYNCSLEEAEKYIQSFIENAEKHIDSTDLDSDVLYSVVQNHPALMDKCASIVEEKWKVDNSEKIENARQELEEVTSTISKKNAEIGDLNILIEKKQAEAAEIESVISRKQQLAQEVETKVAEKIKAARENVADFICEMTFGGIPAVTAEQECIITHNDGIIDSVVEYDNYKNFCGILSDNLLRLGVNKERTSDLAYAMYSAYRNRIPLLFAGPSAAAFGDAFSVSLFGESSAHVSCLREYKENYVDSICGCERNIITFSNILHDKWLNRMVEIMNSSGKYFFFTTPFYEDLSVEPPSSLNYYIPIFTDLLIEEKAKDYHFEGGRAADSFKHFEIKKAKKSSYSDLLKQMKLSPYVRAIYNQQIANVTTMRKEDDPEEMIMIMLLSAAFLTGKTEIVSKYVSDHILNNDFEELVKDFIGEQE